MSFWIVSMVLLLWEADAVLEMGIELKVKGILHCFREMKCQQSFSTAV